jgi:hypothetical protein
MLALLMGLLNCRPAQARLFWDALAIIESARDDRAVGQAGEVSRYQIMPYVWRQYSNSRDYTNHKVARRVAEAHLAWLKTQYRNEFGVEPSETDLCLMWNTGFEGFKRRLETHSWSPALRRRAERFANLRGLAGPNLPGLAANPAQAPAAAAANPGRQGDAPPPASPTPSLGQLAAAQARPPCQEPAQEVRTVARQVRTELVVASDLELSEGRLSSEAPPKDDRELIRSALRKNLETLRVLSE